MMKESVHIQLPAKQNDQRRRLRILGGALLLFSLGISLTAFASDSDILSQVLPLPPIEDLEGFYVMSLVFMCMGLVCFMPSRHRC